MGRNSTDKGFNGVPDGLKGLNYSFTEGKCLNSVKTNVSLSLRCAHIEGDLLLATEEENLWVSDLGVGEENSIAAEERFWLLCSDKHLELRVREF